MNVWQRIAIEHPALLAEEAAHPRNAHRMKTGSLVPVWHASGRGRTMTEARRIARQALAGVGDARLGEWVEETETGTVHIRRRLSEAEQHAFGLPHARDIRGSEEEQARLAVLFADAPQLAGFFA